MINAKCREESFRLRKQLVVALASVIAYSSIICIVCEKFAFVLRVLA